MELLRIVGVATVLIITLTIAYLYWHLADLKYPKPRL